MVLRSSASFRSHASHETGAHLPRCYKWPRTCPTHDILPHGFHVLIHGAPATTYMKVLAEPVMKAQEYRKIVKPLLERRRRARINQCLMELKNLLRETDPSIDNNEANRLEKADILELTVRQLKGLQLQRRVHRLDTTEFRAGFTECANEVAMCVTTLPGLDDSMRMRLIAHLSGRKINKNNCTEGNGIGMPSTPPPSPRDLHLPLSPFDLNRGHHFESNFPRFYNQPSNSLPWRPW